MRTLQNINQVPGTKYELRRTRITTDYEPLTTDFSPNVPNRTLALPTAWLSFFNPD